MAPVQRRHSRREQHIRYEAYRPLMVRDMTSLNAVEEPMMMRARRQAMVIVTATESNGIELRGSTLSIVSASQCNQHGRFRVGIYFAQMFPKWKTSISSESPCHSGGRGDKTDSCAYP